ncbi:hypothetical protein, partial [Mesorhizobium sp. M7A.F.Ca.CA.004.02.1.1]|uniref:hypothetical protein n=1 Tax=Mesorhizobium sp. M7A.F.Ca.CA.004.02.1.1 TaxID=2496690 RepID=UPI0019D21324
MLMVSHSDSAPLEDYHGCPAQKKTGNSADNPDQPRHWASAGKPLAGFAFAGCASVSSYWRWDRHVRFDPVNLLRGKQCPPM